MTDDPFGDWLRLQQTRDDAVGYLSRMWASDPARPTTTELRNRLQKDGWSGGLHILRVAQLQWRRSEQT